MSKPRGALRIALAISFLVLAWAIPAGASSWSPPVTVYRGDPGLGPVGSRVAIDRAGYGVAAFGELVSGSFALGVAERVPGGAWRASPAPLSTESSAYRYAVSIDPAGNALAVWDVSTSTVQTVHVSTWHPGAARWSPPRVVATAPTATIPAADPDVEFSASANASGKIVVAWQSATEVSGDGYVTTVYGMVGTPTHGFSQPRTVATLHGNDRAFDMTTAIGAAGDAAIQWTREYQGRSSIDKRSDIEVAVGPAHGGFPPDGQVQITALTAPAYAEGGDVAVDASGDVLSTFFQSLPSDVLPSDFRVESSYRPAGGAFAPPQQVATIDSNWNTNQIVGAFDAHGNATAAWIGLAPPAVEPSNPAILYSAGRPAGTPTTWGPVTQLTDPITGGGLGALRIAEAADGSAILAIDPAGSWDRELLLARSGSGAFGAPEELTCIGSSVAIAPDDDAVASCTGAHDHSEQIATRGTHDSKTARPTIAVSLRSARVRHGRLILHGTASGRTAVSITIRRRAPRTAVEVIHLRLRGGAWTRSLGVPRSLAGGRYDVVAGGAHVRGARTSFRLASR